MGRTVSEPERLRRGVDEILRTASYSEDDVHDLLEKVPKRWQRHGDMVILKRDAFDDCRWDRAREKLWDTICDALHCKRLALAGRITDDGHRTPQVELVRGHDSWVVHVDNRIKYTFDVTKCMFSAGNITEKLRISNMDCRNEVVVDLFAGIGYFTLPYLVHAGAAHVHACEWNANAVEALRRNLQLNGVQDRCTVHVGDCREVSPEGVADRVNLGLIPSSAVGWQTACRALNPQRKSCWMHVHENVESKPDAKGSASEQLEERVREVCTTMAGLMKQCHQSCNWYITCTHVEHVKSYAPHIDHVVMDLHFTQSVET